MADLDKLINRFIDDIWSRYDADNSGALNKEETKMFACKILGKDDATYSDEEFDIVFKEFDDDDSGTIEKSEMAAFVKKVTGL